MAERNPSDDQAAFGVFPQLKRNRAKQDREAAKNVPIDLARGALAGVLGAPGEIESLVRMLPYFDEKTILPTSEDIEKRIPLKSDTPVSKAATGLGILGGGFYTGPGSPLRVAGAIPAALKHGAEEFAKASVAGVPHVIKPKGGNWLSGQDRLTVPENDLRRLKRKVSSENIANYTPEQLADLTASGKLAMNDALNNWVDSNLTNYVKKQMGTPEDPVRKLAEEGIIHTRLRDDAGAGDFLRAQRVAEGFPAEGMGRSPLAKQWEDLADDSIRVTKAGAIQDQANTSAKLEKARAELEAHKQQIDRDFLAHMSDLAGDQTISQKGAEMLLKMPFVQKAEILGDTRYRDLQGNVNELLARESGFEKAAGDLNPFVAKLDPETRLYSGSTYDLGFDHIIDVLKEDIAAGRIRPEQLNKVSMEQAVRRTYEYDQEMARKMREAAIKQQEGFPVHKEYPEGYKWIELAPPKELPAGYSVVKDDMTGSFKVVDASGKEAVDRPANQLGHTNVPFHKTEEEAIADALKYDKRLEEALKYEGNTMGHCVGGYCPDVVAGRSRIFSLRDAKGEPHVTVEVEPESRIGFREGEGPKTAEERFDLQTEWLKGIESGKIGNDVTFAEWWRGQNNIPEPERPMRISQIKGKQNAKPKDEYLPYVQDFVKGGNWSTVGDFKNTGLTERGAVFTPTEVQGLTDLGQEVPMYLTKEDIAKLRQARGDAPPAEGMKRGGVAISHNPDTMMLAVNNQKLAGGGLAKLLRAAPKSAEEIKAIAERMAPQMLGEFVRGDKGTQSVAGKTQKQFAKEKEMVHDIRPTGAERPLPKPVDIEQLKGNVVIGIPGDPTIAGQTVHSIGGIPLESPSPQHGGPLYGLGRDDAFWASGLGAANRVQNLAREAGMQYDAPVLGKYIMMGPESINYAQHFADANLSAINPAKMTKAQIESFNNLVREGYPYKKSGESFQRVFPAFPGIENPSEAYLHFSIDPELRKHFNALMQMPTVTEKHGLPSGIDVRHAITEPDLRDLETGVTGKSIGRMKPEITQLGLSEHPTYSHDIPGEFLGSSKYPIPYELSFPDTVRAIRENPKQAPHEFGSLKMVGPRQIIDQQMIDEIKQYEEQIKRLTGKKSGGEVKAPAAYIDGNEFVLAAQKYGLRDDMNTLNKLVALVNQGATVDEAARTVAGGVKKAAGGAITGDDLIIEERPL